MTSRDDIAASRKNNYDYFEGKSVLDFIISHAKNDERPYLEVDILGNLVCGLLDSGASRTIVGNLGWNFLRELDLKLDPSSKINCVVANGTNCSSIGCVSVPFKLMNKVEILDVVVVPELPHFLILGVDFWKIMQIIPDLRSDVWKFSDSCQVMSLQTENNLTIEQSQTLNDIIDDYFSKTGSSSLGCTPLVEHEILCEAEPIKQRYYPVSPHVQKHIDAELDKMLKDEVIERSTSPWSSPVILVPKKDGSYRFCVDYRKLNSVTKKDAYPLPYVSAILDRLRGASYMSSLDIKSAYWQIKLSEKSKEFTAFTVPGRGLYQFRRMPFGLHNSPATWQRLIDRVLGPELEPYVFVYLDDIIVISKTFEHHCELLRDIFRRLLEANLTLSRDKCQFCRLELRYLGYVIDHRGLRVDPDKVSAILNIPTPMTVTEVRRIIGMASWYRRFIPNFSECIAPMSSLLKKNSRFLWTSRCEESFSKLKKTLATAPILNCPDFTLPFVLQTDASNYGLGAVLSQIDADGEKVIAYLSRSLTKPEKNYSVTEKECLAVLWSIEKLRPYLEGSEFTVITDHFSLLWLANLQNPVGRLARWSVRLQQYNFKIIHRKGKEHVVPDCLSRSVPVNCVEPSVTIKDPWYRKMHFRILKDPLKFPQWRIDGGRLFKYVTLRDNNFANREDCWKEVVPKEDRIEIYRKHHDTPISGHVGVFKTFGKISQHYYWPKMRHDIARYVRSCKVCQAYKVEQKKTPGLMVPRYKVSRCWQMISTDLIGPLPRSSSGFAYVLVVTDSFSKFVRLFPIRAAKGSIISKKIEEEIFLLYGVPQYVICDNGGEFKGRCFRTLCKEYSVKLLYNALYHPQANPTERVNRVLKTMIASFVGDNHKKWDVHLAKFGTAVRTSKHEVTGYTPYFVNFGNEQILLGSHYRSESFKSKVNSECDDSTESSGRFQMLQELRAQIAKRINEASERNKQKYDLRHRDVQFDVGMTVWRKNYCLSDASKGFTKKLAPKYVGPFEILKKVSPWTFELKDDSGGSRGVWHAKDLKLFVPPVNVP